MATKLKVINKFYGGITRDEKSKISGVASNIEEVDIFSNADYIQAEQIFSADTVPASSEIYAYTSSDTDVAYAYGKETSANKVRLFSVSNGGADNPGDFTTLFTSADTTYISLITSHIQFFKTTEATSRYLYYLAVKSDNTALKLKRYDIVGGTEADVGTLTGWAGDYSSVTFRVIFGELYIMNGNYVAKVDQNGVFTDKAFTLPNDWFAVDIAPASDVGIILARHADRKSNISKGYWWDLTSTAQFDDSFDIPSGGPQWIVNHKETIKICCAINGTARFFQLSGAFAGSIPIELPGLVINNVAAPGVQTPVSSAKMVAVKDKILYFGLYKTDKSGVYALGQLDYDKPVALTLAKRFNTTDYSKHVPTGLFILGPNFYAAYSDNGTASAARCESNNSPSRSSSGIYESIVIDDDSPANDKNLTDVLVTCKPAPASTDVNVFVASDYGSYTEYFRGDGTSLNTTGAVLGKFRITNGSSKKVFKVKLQLVSSGTSSPIVTGVALRMESDSVPASK